MSEDVRDPADMEAVGNALMDAIEKDYASHAFMKGWHPADCPSEIVGDLLNALDETLSTPAPADASGWRKDADDVGVMKQAKTLLADIVEVWWSPATANYIRAGKLSREDILAAYKIRDFLLASPTPPRPIDMGEIERALEPFSDIAQCFNAQPDGIVTVRIEFSHLRRARQVLAAIKGAGA